jgi:DNA replication protein DnaC
MENVKLITLKERMEELGLSFMAAGFDSFLEEQARNDNTLLDRIYDLIETELIPRKERAGKTRFKISAIPQYKTLEVFDLTWLKGGLTQEKFNELSSLAFVERKENVFFLGPSGVGKTHLMSALGCKACISGYYVYYISCHDLVESLIKAKEQNRLSRKLKWFSKPNILLVDEVGYEPLNAEETHVLFQLINVRYETGSMIMTSNKTFGRWTEFMNNDEAVATASLDRLLHHCHIVSLKADSYRMKDRMKVGAVGFE